MPAVPYSEIMTALDQHKANRRDHLAQRFKTAQKSFPKHVEAMFDFSLTMLTTEIDWLSKIIRQLEAKDDEKRL